VGDGNQGPLLVAGQLTLVIVCSLPAPLYLTPRDGEVKGEEEDKHAGYHPLLGRAGVLIGGKRHTAELAVGASVYQPVRTPPTCRRLGEPFLSARMPLIAASHPRKQNVTSG
jgi:hypothetical protein